ncbi:MAG: mannose-1-phosphate guanylyltransferase/mannose-6-phosphate isomerase [Deltaproteobacteria bacterium]|nr:mannose-1-phosphate guanylyltransferase/mannose-6-phosphate isomerase [Deltaproteobacteria bacterium]
MTSVALFGVILAGGSGTRFWPLSRSQYPKQVLRLFGSESMLQDTISRLLPRIPLSRLAVVTNQAQADIIQLDLYRRGWHDIKLWFEPQGRNTAAAVGLAAMLMGAEAGADIMAVFPADHFIQDQEGLLKALDRGAALAQEGFLVTFGITPTRPDTGYGYIKVGQPLGHPEQGFQAQKFVEKPGLAQATAMLQEGGYYWNSGMFMFRRDILLDAMARHLPELYAGLAELRHNPKASLEEIYQKIPSISLDHGIMEKAANVAVVPVEVGWSDVGTWGALYELLPKDGRGNVKVGRALDLHSRNSLIFASDRLVGTIGLQDTIVVDTPDATLVCHRDRVQEVKDLVAELTRGNLVESLEHLTVERPWGHYTVLNSGPGYQVKRIVVNPGKRLSLQLHRRRAEHWVVVQGTARVTIGREIKDVAADESVFIPLETPHRLENPGPEPLWIIEVQTGSYLGEDDIERLDDDFGRAPVNHKLSHH